MPRIPAYRKSIAKADALLARYAGRPSLLDALNAIAILEGVDSAPSLTELALERIRAEKGSARTMPGVTLGELFDRKIATYAPDQKRSVCGLRCARRFFCRHLGADTPVAAIRPDDFRRALDRIGVPRTRNSVRCRLRLVFNWAVSEGLVDSSPVAGIPPVRVDWKEPSFFRPDRVERIMRAAEAHPGPVSAAIGMQLALGFFAGIRTAEILRARWEDIRPEERIVRVPRPKGFTRGRKPRLVELEENAAAWLARWRDWTLEHGGPSAGPVVAKRRELQAWKSRHLAPAGDSWGNDAAHNVMRHTYATMHVGAFRDAAATALNLGHARGTDILDRHYRGLVPRSVAKTYWDILPSPAPLPPPEPEHGRGYRSDLHDPDYRHFSAR